jgi:transposase
MAPGLLALLTSCALWIVADRGYASHAFRMLIWSLGSRPAIPAKRNEAPVACPGWIYHNRNLVERHWNRLKEWRAVATRYEKTARAYLDVLHMAATIDWLKA